MLGTSDGVQMMPKTILETVGLRPDKMKSQGEKKKEVSGIMFVVLSNYSQKGKMFQVAKKRQDRTYSDKNKFILKS